MQSITISHSSDSGQRLDRFVKKYLPNAPLWSIYKMLRTGKIKVNGKKKDQTYKVEQQDEITFWIADIELSELKKSTESLVNIWVKSECAPLEILYEDAYIMVVNKPAGINVHPGDHKTKEISVIEMVHDSLAWRYDSLTFRPALIHRIDRETSGCLMIAKEKWALETLLHDLQNDKIEKVYHTFTLWKLKNSEWTFRDKLLRIENAQDEAKVRVDEKGQSAVTHYKLLSSCHEIDGHNDFSLIECRLETGRTHQIRVHMSYHGHPILWDKSYGDKKINAYVRRKYHIERQLLHARYLEFTHPHTKRKLHIEAPYPHDFTIFLENLAFWAQS